MFTPRQSARLPEARPTITVALPALFATFSFAALVLLEWQLFDVSPSLVPYVFGFTFIAWGLTLLLIGYGYQDTRRSREEIVRDELRLAYARGDLTTEEFRERREELQKLQGR